MTLGGISLGLFLEMCELSLVLLCGSVVAKLSRVLVPAAYAVTSSAHESQAVFDRLKSKCDAIYLSLIAIHDTWFPFHLNRNVFIT